MSRNFKLNGFANLKTSGFIFLNSSLLNISLSLIIRLLKEFSEKKIYQYYIDFQQLKMN